MKTPTIRALALSLAAAILAATAAQAADPTSAVLKGSVLYRERDALPDNAQVRVQLVDATPGEEPKVYAETTFPTQGKQVPIPFALPVDRAKLEAGHLHALRAYVLIDGKIAYVTRARVNLDPNALPATVTILVVPGNADPEIVDSPAPPGAFKAPAPTRRTGPRGAQPPPPAK